MRAQGYPLSLVCRVLGVSRAGFYKGQRRAKSPQRLPQQPRYDKSLAQRIRSLLDREESFGYRRVWAWLRFKEGMYYAAQGLAVSAVASAGAAPTADVGETVDGRPAGSPLGDRYDEDLVWSGWLGHTRWRA
jgi:hypothetical protein